MKKIQIKVTEKSGEKYRKMVKEEEQIGKTWIEGLGEGKKEENEETRRGREEMYIV